MIIAHTISGSVYEFDYENKQVRRLTGTNQPTLRQGKDGCWRSYSYVALAGTPKPFLVIVWSTENDLHKATHTSVLKLIQFDNEVESLEKLNPHAIEALCKTQ